MEVIRCHVEQWYQIGKEVNEIDAHSEIITIPKSWEGEGEMPMSDVKIHLKGSCSARYQSVHFGVELTVKDVPFEKSQEFQSTLQDLCFERLDDMEPKAQQMLTRLIESK